MIDLCIFLETKQRLHWGLEYTLIDIWKVLIDKSTATKMLMLLLNIYMLAYTDRTRKDGLALKLLVPNFGVKYCVKIRLFFLTVDAILLY